MSLNDYRIRCELLGHSLDVRSVATLKDELVSGSRDKTTKIWTPDGNTYREHVTLQNHTNFVSAVCVLGDGEWICTGSNDSTVCIYTPGSLVPFTVLKGHTSTVCALSEGKTPQTLITGSWDKTARIWDIAGFGTSTSVELKGHEAAVWAVTVLPSGQYVTGSADKLIFYWNARGEKLKVLKGHTDCVRCLIGLPDGSLLSTGNDAIVKHWNDNGELVRELHGHTNYIYSMVLNRSMGDDVIVTSGEDSTIRMWSLSSNGSLGDPITLPAQSVWSVCCLGNGDIVTGTSDGVVRVFTRDPERFGSPDVQKAFQLASNARKLDANKQLGGVNVNELPGPESILNPGTEGQTRIVRQPDGKILCYQWTNGKWECLGDVTGASGGTQSTSGKSLYQGKEYDFVFSVDISDTADPLKLPYNKGEDPWIVAQRFIHTHELPQVYLDQVANFIVKNSNAAPVNATPNSGYQDPFTGGARYIPGSNGHAVQQGGNNVDPFTGGSSYSTQPPPTMVVDKSIESVDKKHFPTSVYKLLEVCDPVKVLIKLKEFNEKLNEGKVTVDILQAAVQLSSNITGAENDVQDSIDALKVIITWPKEILFPVLDITRMAVRHEGVCSRLVTQDLIKILLDNITGGPANQMMAIRCLANMMVHESGRGTVIRHLNNILSLLGKVRMGNGNLQIAISTFYLNITVLQVDIAVQDVCNTVTEHLIGFLQWANDLEAQYRSYQALGNLTCTPYGQMTSAQIISTEYVVDKLREYMTAELATGFEKLNDIARDLTAAL